MKIIIIAARKLDEIVQQDHIMKFHDSKLQDTCGEMIRDESGALYIGMWVLYPSTRIRYIQTEKRETRGKHDYGCTCRDNRTHWNRIKDAHLLGIESECKKGLNFRWNLGFNVLGAHGEEK
jgi:hypothetical protein